MSSVRDVGDRDNQRYLARNPDGDLVDATVAFHLTDPDGTATTPTVTHTATGVYDVAYTGSTAGEWTWYWEVSGTIIDRAYGSTEFAEQAPPVYAELAKLKKALTKKAGTETLVDREDLLLDGLDAASRLIEDHCGGRRFWCDRTVVVRTFLTRDRVDADFGSGEETLLLDDIASATGLVVEVGDGTSWTTLAASDYETWPDNALTKREPVTALLRVGGKWSSYRRVRVTARWGWPAIPVVVAQATLLQASRLFKRTDSPEGVVGNAEWGVVRVSRADPDVAKLVERLVFPAIG